MVAAALSKRSRSLRGSRSSGIVITSFLLSSICARSGIKSPPAHSCPESPGQTPRASSWSGDQLNMRAEIIKLRFWGYVDVLMIHTAIAR